MGTFHVVCTVENPLDRERREMVPQLLVDTGSEHTWIPREVLERLGIRREKELDFVTSTGARVTRAVGFAIVRIGATVTSDDVVFGIAGDLPILGARTLEGLNLTVDNVRKRLVPGGPVPAAATSARRAA